MRASLESCYRIISTALAQDAKLAPYLFLDQKIPEVHRGTGPIRLIVLGQDPTVKDKESRKGITRVLNLRGYGAIHNYLQRVCLDLGLELDKNIYATNYVKNFFTEPPTQIKKLDVLALAGKYWSPLLHDELSEFPDVPVIALGQPLLERLVTSGASPMVRNYWDYQPGWRVNPNREWRYLPANQNILDRIVFPFPHQPSLRKTFYRQHLPYYLQFVRKHMLASG